MQDAANTQPCPAAPARGRRRLADGGHGAIVSTRADLEAWLPRTDDPHASGIDPELETGYFQEWVRQGGSGCLFAQNRSGPDHRYVSIGADRNDLTDLDFFDRLQHRLADAQQVDAVLIHLVAPTSVAELAAALVAFGRSEHWFLTTSSGADDPDHVLIALRWPVPGTFVAAEVLGFADLDCLPPTRRAPTTTLMLRTAPPPARKPSVHLAQIPYLPREDERIDFYWQATRSARAALTPSCFDQAAQAPISLRLPRSAWEKARRARS